MTAVVAALALAAGWVALFGCWLLLKGLQGRALAWLEGVAVPPPPPPSPSPPRPTREERLRKARDRLDDDMRLAELEPDPDEREGIEARARARWQAARWRIEEDEEEGLSPRSPPAAAPPRGPPRIDLSRFYRPGDVLISTLTVGGSGSGKTFSSVPKYVYVAERGDLAAQVIQDIHGQMIPEIVKHAVHRGFTRRLVIDRYREFDRVLPVITLLRSKDRNPQKRASFDDVTVLCWMDLLWSMADRQGEDQKSIHSMPALGLAASTALRVLLLQPEPVSPGELRSLCRLKTKRCRELAESCEDEEAREWWIDTMRDAAAGRDRAVEERVGAFIRLVRQAISTPFVLRCGAKTDLLELLLEKKTILLDGAKDGSVHPRTVMGLYRATNMAVANELMALFVRTGEPAHTVLVWEEAAATRQIGQLEIDRVLREGRKTGLHGHILTQDLAFADDEVIQVVKGCTRRKEFYNPYEDELGTEMGRMVGFPQLDKNEVAQVRESVRQLHAGFSTEKRRGRSVGKDADGRERVSESENEAAVPIYKEVMEQHVQMRSPDDQIKFMTSALMRMPQGFRMVLQVSESGVTVSDSPEPALLLPDPFAGDKALARKKIERAVAGSRSERWFVSTVDPEETCPQTQAPAAETTRCDSPPARESARRRGPTRSRPRSSR